MRNRKSMKRRSRKTRKQKGGLDCPRGLPPRMCDKYKQKWSAIAIDQDHFVNRNFKSNLNQTLRNRDRRLIPEDIRVVEARSKFNWKSRVPRFNAIRKGEVNNNLSDEEIQNIHEATNSDFPEVTGKPEAFNTFTGPPELGAMRKKLYRNNIP